MLGTDLLIGGTQDADDLAAALCAELEVDPADIYQAKLFAWEQSPSLHSTSGSYFSALGQRNTILIRELSGQGEIGFIVEIEFLTPVSLTSLQRLADVRGLVVGLSRDTAFPEEAGTLSGEGYVLFRPETAPRPAIVLEDQDHPQRISWGILNETLPPLPEILLAKEGN
ncbi:MAG: hypothetical protein P1U83_12040 [Roseovarius sp.]|nr:hypothetical protein [Roseovarius sp.]